MTTSMIRSRVNFQTGSQSKCLQFEGAEKFHIVGLRFPQHPPLAGADENCDISGVQSSHFATCAANRQAGKSFAAEVVSATYVSFSAVRHQTLTTLPAMPNWNAPSKALGKSWRHLAAGLLLAVSFVAGANGADWTAASAPEFDQLFQRTNGWLGADGDFAVALTNGLTLWLFSDTLVGEVRDGRRVNAKMINNSAAWQHGNDPAGARVEFFYGQTAAGKPASLITPADGKGWFWLFDGVLAQGKLYLFLTQVERTDGKAVFGFRLTGTWLGAVANPLAPPTQWRVTQKKIPFVVAGTNESRFFGSALLATNGFVYIFGTREHQGAGRSMILGRAPETNLGDFSAWQFRTRDGWSTNAAAAADLCRNVASEYSVTWSPALQRYVLICTENGLSDKILARTAVAPWGPWSAAAIVYRCPEAKWNQQVFCYAAKAHPMLAAGTNELIVTYAANSFELGQLFNDARLYWPRFARVNLP
jgi:hypothetical protein